MLCARVSLLFFLILCAIKKAETTAMSKRPFSAIALDEREIAEIAPSVDDPSGKAHARKIITHNI
jgi:hypothetical protein